MSTFQMAWKPRIYRHYGLWTFHPVDTKGRSQLRAVRSRMLNRQALRWCVDRNRDSGRFV